MRLGPPPTPNRAEHPFVGSLVWRGLAINIENRAGSYRSGVDVDGNPWRTQLRNHYGEFALTLGMDGDPVDVFIGPDLDAPDVYVVHTKVPGTQRPDEDKAIIGARSQDEARRIFMDNYDRRGFYHGITKWKAEEFVAHLRSQEHEGKRLDEPLAKGEPADEHTSTLGELKAWRVQTEPEDLGGYSLGKGPKGVSSSAPNYRPSTDGEPRCATCQFQQAGECLPYGFRFEQGYICDSWSPTGGAGFDYETTMEPEERAARAVLTDIQHQADEAIEAIQHQAAEQAEDIVRWAPRATKATTSATIRATVPQDLEGMSSPARDLIPGGLADDKTDADFDPKALDEGAKVEAEHTSNRAVAREIARDHLTEDPDYYDKLDKIEAKKGREAMHGRPVVLMRRLVKAMPGMGLGLAAPAAPPGGGAPGPIKNRPGLRLDQQKHRWVKSTPDQPTGPRAPGQAQAPAAAEPHPAMGRPVRFRHPQTGETLQGHVTGVGAHGATIHTAEGQKHKVPHGHYAVQGGAASQGEAQGPAKGAEQPQGAPAAQAKPQGPPRPRSYDAIKQAHQKLDEHEQARRYFTDRNTGLLNARGADAQPHDPKRPMTARFSFEGMKAFNDQFGHDIPDGALRHMAAALSKHIPDGVKRGGDIEGDVRDQSHADKIAEEMSKAIDPSGRIRVIATAVPRKPNHRDTLEALGDAHRKRKDAEVEAGRLGHRLKNPVAFQKDQGGMKAVAERMKAGPKGAHARLSPHHKAEFDRVGKDKAFEAGHVEDTGLLTDDGFHRSHELNPDHHVASADMRGLQGINDAFGRDAADMILKEFSSLIARNGGGDFHAAHPHGDEYLAHHEDPAKLREFFGHLKNAADGVAFFMERGDGQVVVQHGLNFVHGVGKDLDEADRVDLARNKQAQGDVQPPAVVNREEAHRRLADLGRRGVRLIDLGASAPASIRPVQGQGAPGPVERMVAGRHADQELALRRALEYAMERGQAAEVDRFRSEWEQAAEEAGRELLAEGQEAEFDALMDERDDLGAKLTAEDLRKVLGQAELVAKDGVQFRTGSPVTFRYARALAGDQSKFGADIQPAGVYLFHLVDEGGMKAPGWDTGTMSFRNPLVLEWVAATSEPQGWRARLSYHFGGKRGKDLSRAIRLAGYDGVVTVRGQWQEAGEIVDLRRTVDWANTAPVQVLMRLGRSLAVIDPMRLATQLGLFGAQAAAPAAPAPKHEATVHVKAHVRTTADGKAVLVPAHDRVVEKVEDEPRVASHDAFRMRRHEIDHALMEHADHAPTVAALKAELARREAKRTGKATAKSAPKPAETAAERAAREDKEREAAMDAAVAQTQAYMQKRGLAPKAIDKLKDAEKRLDALQSAQGGTYKRVQASVRQADRVDALKAKAIEEARKKAAAEGRPYFRDEFLSWFGDWAQEPDKASKVVDKNGIPEEQFGNAPVKVFHGTPFGGFRSFSKEKDKGHNIFGKGFYFTADRGIAEEYTKKDESDRAKAAVGWIGPDGAEITHLTPQQTVALLKEAGFPYKGDPKKPIQPPKLGGPDDPNIRDPLWDSHGNNNPNGLWAILDAVDETGQVHIPTMIRRYHEPSARALAWNPTAPQWGMKVKTDSSRIGMYPLPARLERVLPKGSKPVVPESQVFEVYLNIRNPIDMDRPIPMEEFQDLAAFTARKERKQTEASLAQMQKRLAEHDAKTYDRREALLSGKQETRKEWEARHAAERDNIRADIARYEEKLREPLTDDRIFGAYPDDLIGFDKHKAAMGKDYTEPHTYQDYLKLKGLIRNQKRHDGKDAHGILKIGPENQLTWGDLHYMMSNGHDHSAPRENFLEWAKSRGYDGIHHTGGWNIGSHEHSVWIAFEPNQIKATTSEKFDPSTDDMYKGHRLVVRMDLARVKAHVARSKSGTMHTVREHERHEPGALHAPSESALRSEFAKHHAHFEEVFKRRVRAIYTRIVEKLGPTMHGVYNDWDLAKPHRAIRPYLTAESRNGILVDGAPWTIDEQELDKAAKQHATALVGELVDKCERKVKALDAPTVIVHGPGTFTVRGRRNGRHVSIEQDMILNVSSKGTLFNQWPARIKVDGKRMSEKDYAKLVGGES